MNQQSQTHVIEINGVKLEVDLRHAKRIDQLQIGSRVKCLIKKYNDEYDVLPGIIVGFEPFENLPSIVVAYLEIDYSSATIKFKSYNAKTKDFEIVADIEHNSLEVNKADVVTKFDREIEKKRMEVEEIESRKKFFLDRFGIYFADQLATA
jgi:hypothetical protein